VPWLDPADPKNGTTAATNAKYTNPLFIRFKEASIQIGPILKMNLNQRSSHISVLLDGLNAKEQNSLGRDRILATVMRSSRAFPLLNS
jgi:hypothetical protein